MFGLSFLTSKLGLTVAAVAAAFIGLWLYTKHVRSQERALVVAEYVQREQAEAARREGVIAAAQRDAETKAEELAEARAHNETLLQEIARASAANDSRQCLDPAAADRLRDAGGRREDQPDNPAGPGGAPR